MVHLSVEYILLQACEINEYLIPTGLKKKPLTTLLRFSGEMIQFYQHSEMLRIANKTQHFSIVEYLKYPSTFMKGIMLQEEMECLEHI